MTNNIIMYNDKLTIRELRECCGLDIEEVARIVGRDESFVREVEDGFMNNNVSKAVVCGALCRELRFQKGCPQWYLAYKARKNMQTVSRMEAGKLWDWRLVEEVWKVLMSFDREKYKRQHMAARKESFLKEEKMGKTTKRRQGKFATIIATEDGLKQYIRSVLRHFELVGIENRRPDKALKQTIKEIGFEEVKECVDEKGFFDEGKFVRLINGRLETVDARLRKKVVRREAVVLVRGREDDDKSRPKEKKPGWINLKICNLPIWLKWK